MRVGAGLTRDTQAMNQVRPLWKKYEDRRELQQFQHVDDPNLPGEMSVTVTLKKVSCGTEISIVQAGVPEIIPLEMCYLGWQESLEQLATLVEPEIPG